jgi:hypothetical protein
MRNKILDALKAKFEGVSEAILGRIAEKLAKTVTSEEGVQPAVDGVTFQQVVEAEADRRATEATQTAINNYEKKHGLKDGLKVPAGGGTDEPGKKNPADGDKITSDTIVAAIAAAIKPLGDEITALKVGKVAESRKTKLDELTSKLPDSFRKPYNRVPLKDMSDDEFSAFITETATEVDGLLADIAARGSVLKIPHGGDKSKGKEPTKEEAAKVLENLI